MTEPVDRAAARDPVPDAARGIRRLLTLLLVVAIAGAGAALGLAVTGGRDTPAAPSIFAATFRETGFIQGSARLVVEHVVGPSDRRLAAAVSPPAGGTAYLVARCDRGTVTLRIGATGTSQPCTGRAVGVLALHFDHRLSLTATVSAAQRGRWGVAVYR